MKPQTAILKLRLRLNKIHSSDYDNIPDYAAVEAINKVALEITRRIARGVNHLQQSAEETVFTIDDINFLLKPADLAVIYHRLYAESDPLPSDYLYHNRVTPIVTKGTCSSVPITSHIREEANADLLLNDWAQAPSLDWDQTFHTLAGGKIKVYTGGDFFVEKVKLNYYRKPIPMDIEGYTHEDSTPSASHDLEFNDDLANIIIDEAASVIAGDIESNAFQPTKGRAEENL
jgi:hypothetical protein